MGADQIRNKPFGLELLSRPSTALGTDDLGFSLHHQGMNPFCVSTIEAVSEMVKALGNAAIAIESVDTKGHHLVLPLLGQTLNDVDVLPRKVLMNEKDSH